jgi:aspartate aminotransferase-like enzyme
MNCSFTVSAPTALREAAKKLGLQLVSYRKTVLSWIVTASCATEKEK